MKVYVAFVTLEMIYVQRQCLSQNVKKLLCDSLILSQFNNGDVMYGPPCLDNTDSRRVQKLQNACVRLICGIKKYGKISNKFKQLSWLNMYNRRLLHFSCLCHKVYLNKIPPYLQNRLTFRTDIPCII